ncbi:ZIP family metal transporter [Fictibacillus phosphorivorans]|uniref:ZIP family metal transporter n=1 Tax=Fictibacillus phosphorivorans TaxID=1221500 RepID=UPI00203C45FF|nr:ZIP family metal transporter [Fictibacillus phosphorivorans]MCM3718199.1 ZIP family metal transporter [Fictibacillus phosphorivorans]MCM3775934.1 ZIP family metal transporter [Fictibacillus phosphorivorans]
MLQAALWGGIAGSAVLLGSFTGLAFSIPKKWTAWIMAFGTGILIGAVSFELLVEAVEQSNLKVTAIGFILGASIFTIINSILAKKGGHERKMSGIKKTKGVGMTIFFGTLLDAIPESVLIGSSLIEQSKVSWLLVIAIFLSNFPEGLSSSIGLLKEGFSKKKIIGMWISVFLISAIAALLGFVLLENASVAFLSLIGAFAGGAIMAMVASTMLPEAHEDAGAAVGLITSLGLLCSLVLTHFS